MIDCVAGNALQDVLNYAFSYLTNDERNLAMVIEVNCRYSNGGIYGRTDYINNLSTCHNGINVLRCGCSGMNSRGPIIADVNGCRSINIDCMVYDGTGNAPAAYSFDNSSAHRAGDVTLIDCTGYVSNASGKALTSSCKTELVRWPHIDKSTLTDAWVN